MRKSIYNFLIRRDSEVSHGFGKKGTKSSFFFGCHSFPVFMTRFWYGDFHSLFLYKDAGMMRKVGKVILKYLCWNISALLKILDFLAPLIFTELIKPCVFAITQQS